MCAHLTRRPAYPGTAAVPSNNRRCRDVAIGSGLPSSSIKNERTSNPTGIDLLWWHGIARGRWGARDSAGLVAEARNRPGLFRYRGAGGREDDATADARG